LGITLKPGKARRIRGIPLRYEFFIAMILLFIFCGFSDAKCACGSGGDGSASYDFLGDPAVNMDMSSFDEFVSDNLGDMQSKVSAKTVSEP
jgi:hypothetical protein